MKNLIIISAYPPESTYSHTTSALASFTHNLVSSMLSQNKDLNITILADEIESSSQHARTINITEEQPVSSRQARTVNFEQDQQATSSQHTRMVNSPKELLEDSSRQARTVTKTPSQMLSFERTLVSREVETASKLTIKRVWKKNDPLTYIKLLQALRSFNHNDPLLIQFEWKLFGHNILYLFFFPLFLCALRLFHPKIFLVSHGILTDSIVSRTFYRLLALFCKKIIVLEQKFVEELETIGILKEKITFIPHGVDTNVQNIDKQTSREKLGIKQDIFMMVFFGFLAPYKGPDKLLEAYITSGLVKDNSYQLYFVGGPTLHNKSQLYKKYLKSFTSQANQFPDTIHVTGFVPQEEISLYLSACDLMIFPYQQFLSSSGPLSFAFSFEKPILFSENLASYFHSPDFRIPTQSQEIQKNCILSKDMANLNEKINWIQTHETLVKTFTHTMKQTRSWENIANQYEKLIFT